MKWLLTILILLSPGVAFAQCEKTIDGACYLEVDIIEGSGEDEPAPAPSGKGRMYFDSSLNKWRCSEDEGAYVDCIGAGGGGGGGLVTLQYGDISQMSGTITLDVSSTYFVDDEDPTDEWNLAIKDIYVFNTGDTINGDLNVTDSVVIGSSNAPAASIILDLSATDKALRVTQVADPTTDITTPAEGMIVYDSTDAQVQAYVDGSWVDLGQSGGAGGLWTDGGTTTYLTSQTDDVAIGGTNSSAPFFFDESAEDLTVNGEYIEGSPSTSANADFETSVYEVSSSLTLTGTMQFVLCDATSGNVTATLPTAASGVRRIYDMKKIDASGNTCIYDGDGSETIDGSTTVTISSQYEAVTIQSDGTEWWIK